jgi:hypothetical protein
MEGGPHGRRTSDPAHMHIEYKPSRARRSTTPTPVCQFGKLTRRGHCQRAGQSEHLSLPFPGEQGCRGPQSARR